MANARRRHSVDVPASSRFSGDISNQLRVFNGGHQVTQSMVHTPEQTEVLKHPSDCLHVMKSTKDNEKLLYACGRIAQALQYDEPELATLEVEEIVRVTYQVMINHPLNSDVLQLTCEVFWRCNERVEYRHVIEEYAVFRPILSAIKNHKKNPYLMGTALHALASIAESALSCKELRLSQAYLDIAAVIRDNKFDIDILIGGLSALANVLRGDLFAQNNLLQMQFHKVLKEIIELHRTNSEIVNNVFLVLRQLASAERCKSLLLEDRVFQACLELLQQYTDDPNVVTSICGVIEALASVESPEFLEAASGVPLGSIIFSCLLNHSDWVELCCYGFLIFNSISFCRPLLVTNLKLEELLRLMSKLFEPHQNHVGFQEAFCRCLSGLFEASPQLHMFVGEGGTSTAATESATEESSIGADQIRVPLVKWIWFVLLSNLTDTQHYGVFEAVCLVIYYLVVDSDRLQKHLLEKGAVPAIYEGLRRYIGLSDPKFEKCLQYGCQALIALIMRPDTDAFYNVKKFLVSVDAVYDLIDILDHHVMSPEIATEALGVIACLSDNADFRSSIYQQNIHTRILNLIQYKPTHTLLVESAVEVLIIFAQLDEKVHTVFNESGIYRELIEILNRDMGDTVTRKCLMLLHLLADEEHISTYPKDGQRIAWLLSRLIIPDQQDTLLTIEALVCACSLCKSCSNVMPQFFVDYEVDINIFKLLYNRANGDMTFEPDNPNNLINELAIDVIHSLSLKEDCRHKMLLSAVRHSMVEAIRLIVSIGADINTSNDPEGLDSAIYQAVLTRSTDVVECILEFNVTNRLLLKDALTLARKEHLDHIIGLLLKALGLDKEKRILNIGGLNLGNIKPTWIYPALGIHKSQYGHRRKSSLDFVIDGLKRRGSVTSFHVPELASGSAMSGGSAALGESVIDGGNKPDQVTRPRRPSEAEDAYRLAKSWDPRHFEAYSLPSPTDPAPPVPVPFRPRFPRTNERQKRSNVASRPPLLPTVISSPLTAPKSLDYSQNGSNDESLSFDDSRFLGSEPRQETVQPPGGIDEIDGGRHQSYSSIDREQEGHVPHVPQRRHVDVATTMTGASHVAFSTLSMFQQQQQQQQGGQSRNRLSTITSLVGPLEQGDGKLSPGHVRRAALRCQKKKGVVSSNSQSRSMSPFHSSDEVTLMDGLLVGAGSYNRFLSSVTTTPKEKRSELLSSLITSSEGPGEGGGGGGVDEPDMAPHNFASLPANVTSFSLLLKSLDMSSNELRSLSMMAAGGNGPSIPAKLRELVVMDLKQNLLLDLPHPLFQELTQLKSLQLGQNCFITVPIEIGSCHSLVELDLAGNQISSFPQEKLSLVHLEKLNLSNNSLAIFPVSLNGEQFPSLRVLHLESNQIAQIEDRDTKLKSLQELHISKNSLKVLPFAFLAGLNSLKTLDASRNSLELIPGEAAEYTCSLQELKVGYNKLAVKELEFHSFIKTALVIQLLDVTDNGLTSIPPPYMWRSRGLKHLLLGNNKISSLDLSDSNRFWPHLERLVVSENKLKEIPPDIGKLRTLTCLDISHNRDIRHLPNEMGKLELLFYLNLQGLKNLDVDQTQSARAIVHYLKAKLTQSRPCYVMKMTVVGSAGKGKTTLLHLLLNEKSYKNEGTATLGVQIQKWIYQQRPGVQYVINCWDFAGQEEFYSTHQCFLTPRAIYILVYNLSKAEAELSGLVPWLLNIEARAPGSPVIIVGTHRDMIAEEHFSSVRKNMRQQINEIITKPGFPRDVTFAEVSCVGQKVGLDNLRAKIKEKIDGAKLRGQKIMGELVPASYLELSNILEEELKKLIKMKSNFRVIRRKQLDELISKNNLTQKMDHIEVEQAIKFLHECGTLLHYDDLQSNLSDLYFLDPQWLCSMMAKIITIKQLTIISKGILHVKDLPLLLRDSRFPPEFTNEYIRLMEWFDVALQSSADKILIPSYLPKNKPDPIILPPDSKIVRRYNMCFIPPGFWPRLVIRLLSFPQKAMHATEAIKQEYWYSGLYSFWSLHDYFIIEQSEDKNEFDITVPNTATGIRSLCSVVDNVETLIDEWFPGLRNVDIASGDPLVKPSALCPLCPAYNTHAFPMRELQQLSITKDEVVCPVHKDTVPLELLSPDIIISDLKPSYHISRDDIAMDETNPATVLGKGGFGEVYKALFKGRTVAVKAFSPRVAELHNTTPNQLIRQEVSIISQLSHPNIILLVGVCLRPKPMLILEYAELGSLSSFSPYSTVSPSLKHRISLQVVSALAFLHKNNVIYRDLKPGNILIFSLNLNAQVNAKLSDYGISTYATATGLSQDIGTAGYKAPEILKAKSSKMPYNTMVDIYSFGIVLYQLITNGHTPFEELLPHERDDAIKDGLPIKDATYYNCPPWPDMYDVIQHCLQYIPSHRPSAQEIFDRMCAPEFMALRHVISIHQDWEVLTFAVRQYYPKGDKKHEVITEAWLSSCNVGQQSMLSVVNLTEKTTQPQGHMMSQSTIVYSMVTIGQSHVLLGTSAGHVIVRDCYDKKEHRLAVLADSVLCLCYVKRRIEGKSYVFAGLANGTLVGFNLDVLQTPSAAPEILLPLNKGPVKGLKRHHNQLFVISGLEVFVINLEKMSVEFSWIACEDVSRKFLTCIEVDQDAVWTSFHHSPVIQAWDIEDGGRGMTINTSSSLQKIIQASSEFPDQFSCRVTAMYLQKSVPSLLWVGIASGHLMIFDTTTGQPLMITRRHTNAIRSIQSIRTTNHERPVNVVLTCGLGFTVRPSSASPTAIDSRDNYGVLLLWDCSMPQVKPTFDEMRKRQHPFR